MSSKLFSDYKLKDLQLKNRIVMAPMCMYSCENSDGIANDWHFTHYISRAVGQVGLIIQEATAVTSEGRITEADLGIWNDQQADKLKELVKKVQKHGTKIGIQLAHAGRKSTVDGEIIAPSPLAFDENSKTPVEMDHGRITDIVEAFRLGAKRAKEAGYDLIEIHAAHGYLINEFLSPLTNQRTDAYGGSLENRYRFLEEILTAVKTVWTGPLLVRVSAEEYGQAGLTVKDHLTIAKWLKEAGVDLIDVSTGGVVPVQIKTFPGYQVPAAEEIKKQVGIPTGAVGLITSGLQAEEILQNNRADLIFIGRDLLRDPYWPRRAAADLKVVIESPSQYERGWNRP